MIACCQLTVPEIPIKIASGIHINNPNIASKKNAIDGGNS